MNKRLGFLLIALSLFTATVASAEVDEKSLDQAKTTIKRHKENMPSLQPNDIAALDACTPKPQTLPALVQGTITTSSCYDSIINSYEDIYAVTLYAGQTVTIDYSSTAFETFLYVSGGPFSDFISSLSSGVSRRRIVWNVTTTKTYNIEAETLYGPGDGQPYTGNYLLNISTTGGPTCLPNATTMCLNNDRFAVSATWSTSTANGQASVTKLTGDSGYLTFFSASNIEVVIKVLNACGLNSKYWVFAGGLTDVNVTLTVRDTKTNTVKTYTNPAGTPFQPIQDTSALATCP